jgi:carbamoyl-phosphate synthase large subunit
MKSVGEVMAIGRTFKEALQKALRSLEIGLSGLEDLKYEPSNEEIKKHLREPCALRVLYIKHALKNGYTIDEVHRLTHIDPWFLENIRQIVELEDKIKSKLKLTHEPACIDLFKTAKEQGFSDLQISRLVKQTEEEIRNWRKALGIKPDYKLVDTCAAEFAALTPYYYSTYE